MTETAEQKISRLERDNARISAERDHAIALAAHARNHLLTGADENTLAGKFWANETRHAFAAMPEAALAQIRADEVDQLAVDIAYDDLFYDTTGDTSMGMRRAVRIATARSEALRAQGASVAATI